VIGHQVGGDHPVGHVLTTMTLDRPRRALPRRKRIEHERHHLSSTGRRNALWPVTLKLGSDELTFWVTAAVVVEARPEGGPERR
jgi:hypothetical protein